MLRLCLYCLDVLVKTVHSQCSGQISSSQSIFSPHVSSKADCGEVRVPSQHVGVSHHERLEERWVFLLDNGCE